MPPLRGPQGPDGTRPGSIWPALAEHAGAAYLRYAFTKGTEQEVGFLWDALGLRPGWRVLDVGCGPGRHSLVLARRGVKVVGVDIAAAFLELARDASEPSAGFVRADARRLPVRAGAFDAVICLCQGAFGLLGGDDRAESEALSAMAGALRPGGRLAVSAFSAWYALRWLGEGEDFDPVRGVLRERARVRGAAGRAEAEFALTSTCFTPRELRLMAAAAGLRVEGIWSVEPGHYGRGGASVDLPEWLVLAEA